MEIRNASGKSVRKEVVKLTPYRYIFWTCLVSAIVMLAVSFMLPPPGEIHPTVLQGAAILMGFSVIGIVPECLKLGKDVKVTKGDLEVSLSDGDDD